MYVCKNIYIYVDPTEPGADHEHAAVSRAVLKWRAENGASLALLLRLALQA